MCNQYVIPLQTHFFQVFVVCVVTLMTAVIVICYWIGLPYWWERNCYLTVVLVIVGNWLLVNTLFHYYMGVVTSPGYPPQVSGLAMAT